MVNPKEKQKSFFILKCLRASYDYNALRLLQSVTVSKTYSYYPNRSLKTYTNPEQVTYTYQYNGNGQITSIDIPEQGRIAYTNYLWQFPSRINLPGGAFIEKTPDGFMRFAANSLFDPAKTAYLMPATVTIWKTISPRSTAALVMRIINMMIYID